MTPSTMSSDHTFVTRPSGSRKIAPRLSVHLARLDTDTKLARLPPEPGQEASNAIDADDRHHPRSASPMGR
jgi:hypothetical protein